MKATMILLACLLTACSSDDTSTAAQAASADECPTGYECGVIDLSATTVFHIDELRPGEVIPLGVHITRDALPEEGACVAWSESDPKIARGTFTMKNGHPWFEGRIEPTNGAIIGRQSVDVWWPVACEAADISSNVVDINATQDVGEYGERR